MKKCWLNVLTTAIATVILTGAAVTYAQVAEPIVLEGGTGLDACGSVGFVAGVKADGDGDGFLAVRAGPSTEHEMIDKLANGDLVFICDDRSPWLGVVYPRGDSDCAVTSPTASSAPYSGPCPSGWVHGDWVELAAG